MILEVWDYVFFKDIFYKNFFVFKVIFDKFRAEFEYWYLVDLRVFGKDFVLNYFIYYIYNYVVIWLNDR